MPTPYKRARKGRPPAPPADPEFQIQLSAHVAALEPKGTERAAAIVGVSKRVVELWLSGKGNPNYVTRVGALGLLALAGAPPKAE